MKKIKKTFLLIVAAFLLSLLSVHVIQAEPLSYDELAGKDKERVDVVIDVFARQHMVFHPDLSEINNLFAATGILEASIISEEDHDDHDHGEEDEAYKNEKLASRVIRATPDAEGNYHTITLDYIPGVTYTYKEIYRVKLSDKLVTVTRTRAVKGKPERVADTPDPEFMKELAKRLKGKLTDKGVVLP